MHLDRLVLASLIVSGCGGEAHDALPPYEGGSLAASIQAAQVRMHARFAAARRMEESIARSDLDAAHIEAHLLAGLDEPDALPVWRPYIDNIRAAAHQVELATGLGSAAKLGAEMGRSCARCHEATKAHIPFPAEPRPSGAPRMMEHQWAAVQMWKGLIGPSDERWLEGAQALTTVPLNLVAMNVTSTSDLDVDDAARVRLYARRALTPQPQDARAELFGQLLATCAHCHATLRDR